MSPPNIQKHSPLCTLKICSPLFPSNDKNITTTKTNPRVEKSALVKFTSATKSSERSSGHPVWGVIVILGAELCGGVDGSGWRRGLSIHDGPRVVDLVSQSIHVEQWLS